MNDGEAPIEGLVLWGSVHDTGSELAQSSSDVNQGVTKVKLYLTRFLAMLPAFLAVLFLSESASGQKKGSAPPPRVPETAAMAGFSPKDYPKIAVIMDGSGIRRSAPPPKKAAVAANLPDRVEDAFLTSLLAKGYTAPTRSDLDRVLKEQNLQRSGITEKSAARVGKILNVPAVMIVSVTEVSVEARKAVPGAGKKGGPGLAFEVKGAVSARLIKVETGEVLWIGSHSLTKMDRAPSVSTALEAVVQTAKSIAAVFPARDSQ